MDDAVKPLIAVLMLVALGSICPNSAADVLPQREAGFRALIEEAVPLGISIQVAQARIEVLGFSCTVVRGGWTGNTRDKTEFLFCERQAGGVVSTRWQVGLLPREGKVESLRTGVGLVGP